MPRGIEASVLDLRSLAPLDRDAVLTLARHCSRVLIVQEDCRTGSIGESLAAIIQEEAFESLDAPVRILGALDTPVPYSPPLEDAFLAGDAEIEGAARLLVGTEAALRGRNTGSGIRPRRLAGPSATAPELGPGCWSVWYNPPGIPDPGSRNQRQFPIS